MKKYVLKMVLDAEKQHQIVHACAQDTEKLLKRKLVVSYLYVKCKWYFLDMKRIKTTFCQILDHDFVQIRVIFLKSGDLLFLLR